MRNFILCVLSAALLCSGSVFAAGGISGLPDGRGVRLRWLLDSFGAMPKGLAVSLLLFAAAAVVTVLFSRFGGGDKNGKK